MVALCAGLPLHLANLAFGQHRTARQTEPISGPSDIPYESQTDPVFYFTKETFSPYLNTTFRLRGESGQAFSARLVEVADIGPRPSSRTARDQVCFSLTFAVALSQNARQGIYQIEHDALGSFNLFLVPSGRPEGRLAYFQAVINRRHS